MSSSSLETADVWSKAGLLVGSVAIVSLVTSDAVLGGAKFSLSQPLHGLAILILAILMDTCVTVQVGVWLARRQGQMFAGLEARFLALAARREQPEPLDLDAPAPGKVDGLGPDTIDIARKLSARLNGHG